MYEKGEIVYVLKYGAHPEDNGRPAVIVSNSDLNRYRKDITVCYLSNDQRKRERRYNVPVSSMSRTSTYVVASRLTTIDKSRIAASNGELTQKEMQAVEDCLRDILDLKKAVDA